MKNAFTVDLEDWYQGVELPFDSWKNYEERVEVGLYRVLELLDKHSSKATFFTLGWLAEKKPSMIKKIANLGHEIASHGYSHEKVYDLSKDAFREEIKRTKGLLEDASGQKVQAYRAPFFSITSKSLWAIDILKEEGYNIDCSISPVKTWRYGISTCPKEIFKIRESNMIEFPVSTFKLLSKELAIGGAYFRLFPFSMSNFFFNKRTKKDEYSMFYIHPWEYDPEHPKIDEIEKKAKFTHYVNLNKTYNNTASLLKKHKFNTVSEVIENYMQNHSCKEISVHELVD